MHDIINFNKALTEPFSDLVVEVFPHFGCGLSSNFDSYVQEENDEIEQDRFKGNPQIVSSTNREHEIDRNTQTENVEIGNKSVANILHVDEINAKIRSFNFKQSKIFYLIYAWVNDYLKNLNSKVPK